MSAKAEGPETSLYAMYQSNGRTLGWWQVGANLIGACIVTSYFVFFDRVFPIVGTKSTFYMVGIMFSCLAVLATGFMYLWQKDLIRFLRLEAQGGEIKADLRKTAQRKIQAVPLVSALISLFNWFLAAITMSTYSIVAESERSASLAVEMIASLRVFVGCIIGGLVVAAIVFFTTESKCRQIWPYFYPEGGLTGTPGVFRMKLRTRMFVIFILASILPLILMAVLSYNKARSMLTMDPVEVIQSLLYLTAFLLAVTLAVAIILSRTFSTGIVEPVSRMEAAMARVQRGDLSTAVPISSNDELGMLAENFNLMTEGLKDRYRLRRSLDLAKDVQQSLLPGQDPQFSGLDIAGKSIYCDETGGDYYDFFDHPDPNSRKYNVVIGDVSEHGIPSALLMASARAFLRQRSALPGSIADVVSDVNRQLTRDVEDSGRFITLFYLQLDMRAHSLTWVRAGHEPALLYDPSTDRFEELIGEGLALGINENWRYTEQKRADLAAGQIILLSTDGIWEARNPRDEMFGKQALYRMIRQNYHAGAAKIQEAVLAELAQFQDGAETADDITLVIVKIMPDKNTHVA